MKFGMMIVYISCIIITNMMSELETAEKRHMEDTSRSPTERQRAEIKYNAAHFFKRAVPVMGVTLLILNVISAIISGL